MANHELSIPPIFDANLRKYETEDEVHADVFNAVENQLINNDSYLKSHIDTAEQNIKEHKETTDIHVTKSQKDSWTAKATTTEATTTTKGLMSSADKIKLSGIATGAEVNQNAFSNVKVGSNVVSANRKTATIEFTNGTNITIVADNATKKVTINGPSNVTTSTNGLMTKEDKIKLNNIATNANNYAHPTYPSKSNGLYKVSIDGTGHVSATSAVTKADITNLGIPAQDTKYTNPTTSGNKHIPAGGSSGQILQWSADGTATWADSYYHIEYIDGCSTGTWSQKTGYYVCGMPCYRARASDAGRIFIVTEQHDPEIEIEKAIAVRQAFKCIDYIKPVDYGLYLYCYTQKPASSFNFYVYAIRQR